MESAWNLLVQHARARLGLADPASASTMLSLVCGIAIAYSYAPSRVPAPAARHRVVAPLRMAAPQPYRSDANFDYFRIVRELTVTLAKPLGAVMQESAKLAVTAAKKKRRTPRSAACAWTYREGACWCLAVTPTCACRARKNS